MSLIIKISRAVYLPRNILPELLFIDVNIGENIAPPPPN